MNPSQSEHCIRNVRLHVRFRQVEHIAQSKHMDQNVPVPQRWRNQGYTNNTRNTPNKKNVNCGQATKDGWIGEGEARIVLLAFGRRMNNSFRRGCYHNTLQRLAPVAHETRLERLDPIITWHSPFLVPQTRSTGAGTLGGGGGGAAIEGAIRKALSGPEPGSGHLGFPPAGPFPSSSDGW